MRHISYYKVHFDREISLWNTLGTRSCPLEGFWGIPQVKVNQHKETRMFRNNSPGNTEDKDQKKEMRAALQGRDKPAVDISA